MKSIEGIKKSFIILFSKQFWSDFFEYYSVDNIAKWLNKLAERKKMRKKNLSEMAKKLKEKKLELAVTIRTDNDWRFKEVRLRDNNAKVGLFITKLCELAVDDSGPFWAVISMNKKFMVEDIMLRNRLLKEVYDFENNWYHEYALQDLGKDEWLNQLTREWEKERRRFEDFYYNYLFEPNTRANIVKKRENFIKSLTRKLKS